MVVYPQESLADSAIRSIGIVHTFNVAPKTVVADGFGSCLCFFPILTHMFSFFVNYSKTWYNLKAQNKCFSPFRNLFLPPVSTIPKQSGSSDKGRTTKMATSVMRSASSHLNNMERGKLCHHNDPPQIKQLCHTSWMYL